MAGKCGTNHPERTASEKTVWRLLVDPSDHIMPSTPFPSLRSPNRGYDKESGVVPAPAREGSLQLRHLPKSETTKRLFANKEQTDWTTDLTISAPAALKYSASTPFGNAYD
jgi:hypothetical protein